MRNRRTKILCVTMAIAAILVGNGCTREITTNEVGFINQKEPIATESITMESTKAPDYTKDDGVAEYKELEDGTYEYRGIIYTHKNIISGMMPGNTNRSTMVVLDNNGSCFFDVYAEHIIENGKIDYPTANNNYKVVELHHHDNHLQNGRYISEKEDDSLFLELSEAYITFWDFVNTFDEDNTAYNMSSVDPRYTYKQDCQYMIIDDRIEIYCNPARSDIKIIDDNTLEYEGVRYVHENYSTKEEQTVINKTGYPQYDELIDLIVNINTNSENPQEACRSNGISYIFGAYNTYDYSGFYLQDLDGDGIEELLLGSNGSGAWRGVIYMIYTIRDGQLEKVCSGGERDIYRLCTDNYILEDGSSGAANSLEAYYRFENSKLILVDGMVYDGWYNKENPWHLCDESLDAETGTPITSEQVEAIRAKYTTIPIEFTLFENPEFR